MKPVQRDELVDWVTFSEQRPHRIAGMMLAKAKRRIHLGEWLTFLFENRDSVRWQVQEMLRIERIVREADIRHELDTYNELLGAAGELGATLLIEIDDPALREELLPRWLGLPARIYLRVEGGAQVFARFDERQQDERRVSTVQYLKFALAGRAPIAIGTDFPELAAEVAFTAEQRAALEEDLRS